jgi:carboxymethylenebutenolidase
MIEPIAEIATEDSALEIYPGVHRGFAVPQRSVYEMAGAERHWERSIALYRRRLG